METETIGPSHFLSPRRQAVTQAVCFLNVFIYHSHPQGLAGAQALSPLNTHTPQEDTHFLPFLAVRHGLSTRAARFSKQQMPFYWVSHATWEDICVKFFLLLASEIHV